jgi:hypothetical protein
VSKLEAWIRCDGLRPNRKVCGVSVGEDALAGWFHIGEEDLHICPAHLGLLERPDVLPRDSVLALQEDGTLEHATVQPPTLLVDQTASRRLARLRTQPNLVEHAHPFSRWPLADWTSDKLPGVWDAGTGLRGSTPRWTDLRACIRHRSSRLHRRMPRHDRRAAASRQTTR